MSIFVLLVPIFFITGILACYLLGSYRTDLVHRVAAITIVLSLLAWLILGMVMRDSSVVIGNETASVTWTIRIDPSNWQLSTSLLLFVLAFFLTKRPHLNIRDKFIPLPLNERVLVPSILALVLAILVSLWLLPGYGLILTWTLIALAWLLLLWLSSDRYVAIRELLYRSSFMLSGSFFVWMAIASLDRSQTEALVNGHWPEQALPWLYVGAAIQMGAFPFYWWRPLKLGLRSSTLAFIHLLPSLAGAGLMLRIPRILDSDSAILIFLTFFGLLGLLAGSIYSWTHLEDKVSLATGLIISQTGSILIMSGWIGPPGVLSQTKVLVLALGILLLSLLVETQPYHWHGILPLGALSSLPLTVGFASMLELYGEWLDSFTTLLMIVHALMMVLFFVGVIQAFWPREVVSPERSVPHFEKLRPIAVLLLPALGLVAIPTATDFSFNPFAFVTIMITLAGAIVLDFVLRRNPEIQTTVQHAYRVRLQTKPFSKAFRVLYSQLSSSSRRITAIFEGEGGLLWLFVFILVLWLAITS